MPPIQGCIGPTNHVTRKIAEWELIMFLKICLLLTGASGIENEPFQGNLSLAWLQPFISSIV